MIFIFNNLNSLQGIWNCDDINSSGIKRFTISPLVHTLLRYKQLKLNFNNIKIGEFIFDSYKNRKNYKNFIIPSGVTHSPLDWTGQADLDKKYDLNMKDRLSVFSYIDPKLLGMLRKRKAYLLLDQSHEGYHADWLFDWFHDCCTKFDIHPERIIYVTGNLMVEDQYNKWTEKNKLTEKICTIPHIQFEEFIYTAALKQQQSLPSFDDQINYKTKNVEKIKIYNCFQKRNRPHRIWMYYYLYKNDLLADGLSSMNSFSIRNSFYEGKILPEHDYEILNKMLPLYPRNFLSESLKKSFEGPLGTDFENDLYIDETLQSWISIVSEASFAEDTCFISEKSFKPVSTRHPFIICGNKNSLHYLKNLGYKTFEGFIDETYDLLDTWQRYDAIINEIIKIKKMSSTQKIEWFTEMRQILDHNYETLKHNSLEKIPNSILKLKEYVEK